MITKIGETPCWAVPLNDEGDEAHFLTEKEAAEFTARYGGRYGEPHQEPVPCWTATCDTAGCEGVEGNEDGDPVHIPALNARHAATDLQDLTKVGPLLMCPTCREQAYPPADLDPAAQPVVIDHDQLGRVFGLLLHLVDRFAAARPGARVLFDPDTSKAVALVQSFATRQPSTVDGGWAVYVGPFAVQPTLPTMPIAPLTGMEDPR